MQCLRHSTRKTLCDQLQLLHPYIHSQSWQGMLSQESDSLEEKYLERQAQHHQVSKILNPNTHQLESEIQNLALNPRPRHLVSTIQNPALNLDPCHLVSVIQNPALNPTCE
ncbi:hypothetical protein CFOL_v3_22789 [Cephalotus follicularis]|uniref:Uncharacterized protein n=1 Tax=Cephalotus follicularis TaxID=3775 RepID=A0A1Q3CGE8_CEPFO|nr:hypothetical protein CFOL_v3_22789 [Cephalotus follicularis]